MTSPTRGQSLPFLILCSVVLAAGLAAPRQATGETTFTYVKIADTDTPIPGGTGSFTGLGQPALSAGVAAFRGFGASDQAGIYTRTVDDPASLAVRYDRTTPIPGGGGALFTTFDGVTIKEGAIAFRGSGPGRTGIYFDGGGMLEALADTSTAIPEGTGAFTGFGNPWMHAGEVVFFGEGTDQAGIYAHFAGTLRRIVDLNTPIPGGTGNFLGFNGAVFDSTTVVFRGTGSDGQRGVYRADTTTGAVSLVADLNTPLPGGMFKFNASALPGNVDGDAVVFVIDTGTGRTATYLHDGTSLSVVIDHTTPVPGLTSTISNSGTQGIGFEDGHLSFLGQGNWGYQGQPGVGEAVFATLGGVLRVVVLGGDEFEGKTLGTLGTYGHSISGNLVAFHVSSFGVQGARAIFVAVASNDPPVAANDSVTVPEGGAATVNVLANDTDPDSDVPMVSAFTHGTNGTVSCTAAGACTYTASDPDFSGSDSFAYTVSDGRGGEDVGTVAVNIVAVDDADIGVTMTPSQDPAGRNRTLTYAIVVTNAGPERARNVTVRDALPAGTTFASISVSQGTATTPKPGAGGAVDVRIGALEVGARATVELTVNVTGSAPATLVNTVTVANLGGDDPLSSNNSRTVSVKVVNVGTFVLTPAQAEVAVHERIQLALEWTVPGGEWRELRQVHLRLRDRDGIVLWVRLVEGAPDLLSLHVDGEGFGPGKEPGSRGVLSNRNARIHLRRTSIVADGPTDPSVTLTLDLTFKRPAAGRTYVVEVKASDDLGNRQGWRRAGVLTVR